jgi:hypothetical protein
MSSDLFRQSVLNRLPAMPPTAAPWATSDEEEEEELEELDDEENEGLSELGALPNRTATT